MGTYLFRWPYPADNVYVTGTFDDWGKTERLNKVDGGFEKEIHLASTTDNVYYKFVVNDEWIVDEGAPKEDDGNWNVNNVLLASDIKPLSPSSTASPRPRAHRVLSVSSAPPGSFREDALTEAPTVSAGGEGAPLITEEQSKANLARWIPHVIPRGDRQVTRRLTQSSSSAPKASKVEALTEAPTVSAGGVGAPLISKEQSQGNLARRVAAVTPPADRPVTRSVAPTSKAEALTEAPTVSAGGVGAPLISKEQSHGNLARKIAAVTPPTDRPVTRSIPQTDGATSSTTSGITSGPAPTAAETEATSQEVPGAFPGDEDDAVVTAPAIPATGHTDTQSSVTTSKEDFENATGGEGTAGGVVSALPIPAEGHKDIQSSATTSKEDYDKVGGVDTDNQTVSVNPLPATGHENIQSSVTTSKEDYEKAGAFGTAGLLAGAGAGAALAGAFSHPKLTDKSAIPESSVPKITDRNIIPESSLPMDSLLIDPKDNTPFINSAAPGTTTAELASQVPLEPKRSAQVVDDTVEAPVTSREASAAPFIASSGPGTTTAALASQVPLEPKRDAEVKGSSIPRVPRVVTPEPTITNIGAGSTTAGLASQVPLEGKRDASIANSSIPTVPRVVTPPPVISSIGAAATTVGLASQVPLESKREATVDNAGAEAPEAIKESSASPFIQSSGPGTTTADLASQVPLEQKRQGQVFDGNDLASAVPGTARDSIAQSQSDPAAAASPEIAAEKAAVDKELLSTIPTSQATGAPATAAKAQTSYYGLATAVPEPVEESIAQAHASPEAATEPSAVAEKSAVERELQEKVPLVESAGEPAPTISAATATTAPEATSGTAATEVSNLTDGKTANETVPDTDTSTATRGISTGEIAGGAVAGTAAAAGAAALASRHRNADLEPPRIDDSQKPIITTEGLPRTQAPAASLTKPGVSASAAAALSDGTEDPTLIEHEPSTSAKQLAPSAGIAASSSQPGIARNAAAALSDGTEDPTLSDQPAATKVKAPVETSEATAVEYAPPAVPGIAPGVSPSAAAALSDGTEDPTLRDEEPSSQTATRAVSDVKGKSVDPVDQAIAAPNDTVYDKVTQAGAAQAVPTSALSTQVASTQAISDVKGKSVDPVDPVDQAIAKPDDTVHDKVTSASTPTKNAALSGARTAMTSAAAGSAASTPTRPTEVSRSKSMLKRLSGSAPTTPKKNTAGTSSAAGTPASTSGTAASSSTTPKSTTGSEAGPKKKRNRLSQIIHKIFD